MKPYRDLNGDSGIAGYEYGDSWIQIQFKTGKTYKYTASSVGSAHLSTMKRLADTGDGLNAYINTNPDVKKGYV